MSEEEVIKQIESLIDDRNSFIDSTDKSEDNIFRKDKEALQTVLQLLEQKDTRIDELEKALVEEAIKSTEKIKELDNKINKVIDKMIGDKMEQFDDYIIYLIESYLEILEE